MKPYNSSTVLASLDIAVHAFRESQIARKRKVEDFVFIKEKNSQIKLVIEEICYIKIRGQLY